jgi:hypothetical protein
MSDTAYVPTMHHRHNAQGHPSCGQIGSTLTTPDWPAVTCKKCYKSDDWYAHHADEQRRLREMAAFADEIVRTRINEVFTTAREIADRAGYCSTYQEIESEIIRTLGIAVELPEQEFEVEVEFEVTIRYTDTVTVEATSADAAERRVSDSPEEYLCDRLVRFVPDNGYTDAVDTTVESVNVT